MDGLQIKYEKLKDILASYGKVAVAFSAGVDSTLLLKTARDVLGKNAAAVTVKHAGFPERELKEAEDFCASEGIELIKIDFDILSVEGFENNPPERCYICKRAVMQKIIDISAERGFNTVAEGSNLDDGRDYRPGERAIAELGVKSPLREAELTKKEIRALSRSLGLPVWDKPAYACLATRIPHGEKITPEKLSAIERSELFLFGLGFKQSRVRCHGDIARIEVESAEIERFADPEIRRVVSAKLKEYGFRYVSLDLDGYRTGSMNIIKEKAEG